jgi:hypothetical protein
MSDTLKFGVQSVNETKAGGFIDEYSAKEQVEVAERKDLRGITKKVYPHNPTTDLTIKGGGEPIASAGVATADALGLAIEGGVIVVKESETSEKNTDFNEFSISAKHYPEGELGSDGSEES